MKRAVWQDAPEINNRIIVALETCCVFKIRTFTFKFVTFWKGYDWKIFGITELDTIILERTRLRS